MYYTLFSGVLLLNYIHETRGYIAARVTLPCYADRSEFDALRACIIAFSDANRGGVYCVFGWKSTMTAITTYSSGRMEKCVFHEWPRALAREKIDWWVVVSLSRLNGNPANCLSRMDANGRETTTKNIVRKIHVVTLGGAVCSRLRVPRQQVALNRLVRRSFSSRTAREMRVRSYVWRSDVPD